MFKPNRVFLKKKRYRKKESTENNIQEREQIRIFF